MFSMQRHLQMFQQNSYYPSRYFKWLKSSFSITSAISLGFCSILAFLTIVGFKVVVIALAIISLVARIIKQQKNHKASIKKLVYTNRVKRILITSSIIYLLLSVLCSFLSRYLQILVFVICLVLAHFPHFVMLLANLCNKPIEAFINNGFVKDAKRILKSNKNLLTIGVTGSYGKTSVKFILNRILSENFNVTATPESFNTPMGIVRTIRERMKPQTEVFIAEMGAKSIGDIKELCELADPTLAVITAVGPQHLETFGTIENVANTKFELLDHCIVKEKGKIYINCDSEAALKKAETIDNKEKIVYFGTNDKADCRAENIVFSPDGTSFDVVYNCNRFSLVCKLLGKHSVTNILGAVAMALDLGISERQIRFAVSSLKAAPHRLELKPFINGAVLIDDAYNSNPEGCLEAVRVLGSFNGMHRILVTPGLVELGEKEYECNKTLGSTAAGYCDDIILVGKKRSVPIAEGINSTNFKKERLIIADSFKDAMVHLQQMTDRNTVVLFENDLPDNYAG